MSKCLFMDRTATHEAVKLLFELFAPRVLTAALFVLRDKDLAEDVVQETFVTAMDKLHQLKDRDKAGAWLTRIAINKAHNELRRKKKEALPPAAPAADSNGVDESMLVQEEAELVQRALDTLNEEHQLVVYLMYYQEMSVKGIAEVLEIPEGTVKSRLRKARALVWGFYRRQNGEAK